jgi:hypothetical protein
MDFGAGKPMEKINSSSKNRPLLQNNSTNGLMTKELEQIKRENEMLIGKLQQKELLILEFQ